MVNFRYLLPLLLFIVSCNNINENNVSKKTVSTKIINARGFYFSRNSIFKYKLSLKLIDSGGSKLFIYTSDLVDTLKISDNKVFYRNVILKKIDSRSIEIKNSIIKIDKYFFKSKKGYPYSMYLFINSKAGIVFEEFLNSGSMTEYDTKKFNIIHKKIALKQFGFKNGDFELQYASMNYPELNMMDSIKEGNSWRYFIKKEK